MDLKTLLHPVTEDLLRVNEVIRLRLASQVALINDIGSHIIHAGGKRLRPTTTLLAAGATGQVNDRARILAAVIEFIHTATLLHDDVVDHTDLRRGRITANAQWSNSAAVLSGDFLYSRAFQMMVEVGEPEVMRVMADTTNAIAEGEVLQLLNARDPDVDEARYFRVIELKTAVLFRAACQLGAIAAGADAHTQAALAEYGLQLGIAYQLADDVLDYDGDPQESGKAIGNDLIEGKPTLPMIQALKHGDANTVARLRHILRSGEITDLDATLAEVRKTIESTGAIPYTRALAERHAGSAQASVGGLPESPYKTALLQLADFAVGRKH
ncbi:MAG: octaprenyl diphosphate synthase [Nevskiaceae bacterium]|nr:MAG: octaprenyl diphosphate synthase [Nevskiaceae bacterium]